MSPIIEPKIDKNFDKNTNISNKNIFLIKTSLLLRNYFCK